MEKDKYYKPILGNDEHLLESTETPGRFRGLSRTSDNKNPDIPEWEEYVFDNESSSGPPTEAIAAAVGAAFLIGMVTKEYIIPFIQKLPKLHIGATDYSVIEKEALVESDESDSMDDSDTQVTCENNNYNHEFRMHIYEPEYEEMVS